MPTHWLLDRPPSHSSLHGAPRTTAHFGAPHVEKSHWWPRCSAGHLGALQRASYAALPHAALPSTGCCECRTEWAAQSVRGRSLLAVVCRA
jgi:hypothetical protein